MSDRKFGFGIIGAGMIAHVHAKAIGAIGNATLIGLHSRGVEKMEAFASTPLQDISYT
jgi:predicted dehydrogenase